MNDSGSSVSKNSNTMRLVNTRHVKICNVNKRDTRERLYIYLLLVFDTDGFIHVKNVLLRKIHFIIN